MRLKFLAALTSATLAASGAVAIAAAAATSDTRTIAVSTANELRNALSSAQPGDEIALADGTYVGVFKLLRSGTAAAPITITGSANAVLQGHAVGSGYALQLDGADFVHIEGVTFTGAQKGIIVDRSNHVVIDSVRVHHIGMEAVHFRSNSSDNILRDSVIFDTGVTRPGFGEGVYLGTAQSNWDSVSGGQPDASNNNHVIGNTIGPDVRGEAIDIKEGTSGGVIRGNTFDGRGLSNVNYDDSWVDVKGNGYLIADNHGTHALLDGFQTHVIAAGYGADNTFANNTANVGAEGYGFRIQLVGGDAAGNIVCADNKVTGADSGVANVPLTADCAGDAPTSTPDPTSDSPTSAPDPTSTSAPSTTSSSTSEPSSCTIAPWTADAVYQGGDEATHAGITYRAKWWTTGEDPTLSGQWGVWAAVGTCDDTPPASSTPATTGPSPTAPTSTTSVPTSSVPTTPDPTSTTPSTSTSESGTNTSSYPTTSTATSPTPDPSSCTAPVWQRGTVYVGGDTVTYQGATYTAKWWTNSDVPGASMWGAWDSGTPCA